MRVAFAGKPGTAVPAPHLYLELRGMERNDTHMDQSLANWYSDLLVRCTEFRRDCVLFSEIPPLSQMSGKGRRCLNHSKIMQGTALLVPRIAFELDVLYQRESFVYGHFVFISNFIHLFYPPSFQFRGSAGWFRGGFVSHFQLGVLDRETCPRQF